jgi:hypothetical protein
MTAVSPRHAAPRIAAARAPYRAAVLAVAAVLADVAFDPAQRHVPLCPFHAVTGWYCPLCGGLRAADALAHLHVAAAARDNVVLLAALPLLALWWLDWVRRGRVGGRARSLRGVSVVAVVVLAIAFTVVRNLPAVTALRPA